MKPEYDFSRGERGKFYNQGAELHHPIYLDQEVLAHLQERAKLEGVEVNQLVNDMLKHQTALAESVRPEG